MDWGGLKLGAGERVKCLQAQLFPVCSQGFNFTFFFLHLLNILFN